MSIAELIMQGTNRASESTSWVGDSLAKLGQNVGAALAQREQQKQAQAMLPMFQQSMQESMRLAGEGKSGEAYSKLMPFLTDPSVAQNPFMMPALEAGIKMNQVAADDYMRSEQLRIQEGMYNQRSDYNSERIRLLEEKQNGVETPTSDTNRYGFGNISSVDNETVTPLPVLKDYAESDVGIPETSGANQPVQEGTPAQIAGKQNVEGVSSLPPEKQKQASMSFGVTNVNPDQYEVQNIAGLSKYLPDFVGFAVPKETWKETTASLSGKNELSRQSKLTAPEARENFTKDGGTKSNVEKAVRTMSDKTMGKLFNDFGKDIYALRAATDQKSDETETIFTVTGKDEQETEITKDQYAAIETIAGITPAVAENAGGTPAIFKPSSTKETPAELSREEAIKKATEIKNRKAKPTTGATELSLEEEIASLEQKKKPTTAAPAGRGAKMTPELKAKLAQAEQQKVTANTKSELVSELTRLEKLIYDIPRAGQKTLKYEESEPAVQKILKKISEINNQLASL
jgi:hypothetical protein